MGGELWVNVAVTSLFSTCMDGLLLVAQEVLCWGGAPFDSCVIGVQVFQLSPAVGVVLSTVLFALALVVFCTFSWILGRQKRLTMCLTPLTVRRHKRKTAPAPEPLGLGDDSASELLFQATRRRVNSCAEAKSILSFFFAGNHVHKRAAQRDARLSRVDRGPRLFRGAFFLSIFSYVSLLWCLFTGACVYGARQEHSNGAAVRSLGRVPQRRSRSQPVHCHQGSRACVCG